MRITCPLPRNLDLRPLILLGIKEFYFGHIPPPWKKRFSLLSSPNRRYSGSNQLDSKEQLKAALKCYKGNGLKFNLVFNTALYNTWQIGCILEDIADFTGMGLNGVIAADTGLILELRRKFPSLQIHLSCIAACLNSKTAGFFKGIGVNRIILPKSLTLDEISDIRQAHPGLELEALISSTNDCVNIDGLCSHLYAEEGTQPPCAYEMRFLRKAERLNKHVETASMYLRLYKAGIDCMKVLGRGKDAQKIITLYGDSIRAINSLSAAKPNTLKEWLLFLKKEKNGKSGIDG